MITLILNTRRQAGATQWSILDVFREDSWHFPQSEVPTKVFSPEPSMFFSSLQWECHCASGSVTRCCAHRCLLWPSRLTVISQPLNNNGNCFPPDIPRAVEWMAYWKALKVSIFAHKLVQWKQSKFNCHDRCDLNSFFSVQLHWTVPYQQPPQPNSSRAVLDKTPALAWKLPSPLVSTIWFRDYHHYKY